MRTICCPAINCSVGAIWRLHTTKVALEALEGIAWPRKRADMEITKNKADALCVFTPNTGKIDWSPCEQKIFSENGYYATIKHEKAGKDHRSLLAVTRHFNSRNREPEFIGYIAASEAPRFEREGGGMSGTPIPNPYK